MQKIAASFTLFAASLLISTGATLADEKCQPQVVVRCPCPASMSVTCGGAGGYVANDQKAQSVTMKVFFSQFESIDVIIKNPSQGVRSYYGASLPTSPGAACDQMCQELKAAIKASGAKLPSTGELKVSLGGFTPKGDMPLYADPGSDFSNQLGEKKATLKADGSIAGPYDGKDLKDGYEKPPVLLSLGGACNFCVGRVLIKGNPAEVTCRANSDGSCKTAEDCAADPTEADRNDASDKLRGRYDRSETVSKKDGRTWQYGAYYNGSPRIITSPGCPATCYDPGGQGYQGGIMNDPAGFKKQLICQANKDGKCPSASECFDRGGEVTTNIKVGKARVGSGESKEKSAPATPAR